MNSPLVFFLAFAIGIVAGLRTFTAPAALVWALHLNWISLDGTRLAFLHSWAALIVFTLLALIEFVGDQLPSTPNRTKPGPLGARIVSGAFCGTAVALLGGQAMAVGAAILARSVLSLARLAAINCARARARRLACRILPSPFRKIFWPSREAS